MFLVNFLVLAKPLVNFFSQLQATMQLHMGIYRRSANPMMNVKTLMKLWLFQAVMSM